MVCQEPLLAEPSKIEENISLKGIETEPKLIFKNQITMREIMRITKVNRYDFCGFKIGACAKR